jgi:chromosome partitioning protein
MTAIIAIANQKGGVAKTTTTVSLAGVLAEKNYDILLIDLDPQADLTLAFGIAPSQTRRSIADTFLNSETISRVSLETHVPGIDLIPSNHDMDQMERHLSTLPNYKTILRQHLKNLEISNAYDFIFLDCPPVLGAITTAALSAANLVIIPTQPEYFSLHALRNMLSLIKTIRRQENPSLSYRILITMRDLRNRIHRTMSEQLLQSFPSGIFNTSIEMDTKLRECSIAGLPISMYASKSRSALQYTSLAMELIEYVRQKDTQPA